MAGGTRIQFLIEGVGLAKQANITTPSASYIRFTRLNSDVRAPQFNTENDAPEIGKGNEFISPTGVFPTYWDLANARMEKYGSLEYLLWAWAFGLGDVAEAGAVYTLTPLDPTTGLELPYFSAIAQLAEGGGEAIDETYVGCNVESIDLQIKYGAGRATVKQTVEFIGSGLLVQPSGVVLPAVQQDHYALAQSLAMSVNGVDLVAAVASGSVMTVNIGWKNNHLKDERYKPGAGLQQGAAVASWIPIGARTLSLSYEALLQHDSPELAALIAQSTGATVITLTYDATHNITWSFTNTSYQGPYDRGNLGGLATVKATLAARNDPTSNIPLTVSGQCGISGLAQ
jgi:hypothetical protein